MSKYGEVEETQNRLRQVQRSYMIYVLAAHTVTMREKEHGSKPEMQALSWDGPPHGTAAISKHIALKSNT